MLVHFRIKNDGCTVWNCDPIEYGDRIRLTNCGEGCVFAGTTLLYAISEYVDNVVLRQLSRRRLEVVVMLTLEQSSNRRLSEEPRAVVTLEITTYEETIRNKVTTIIDGLNETQCTEGGGWCNFNISTLEIDGTPSIDFIDRIVDAPPSSELNLFVWGMVLIGSIAGSVGVARIRLPFAQRTGLGALFYKGSK